MAKLYFYYSAMNAGKSSSLLQSSYNYQERGMDTLLLLPVVGSRYEESSVVSRIGLRAAATTFHADDDLRALVLNYNAIRHTLRCVLVDEAQFLTKQQVWELAYLADNSGIPVLTYGLRSDFLGEPFEGSKYLLALADEVVELKTICHCGRKATMNLRIDEFGRPVRSGAQVLIGGNDRYVAVCRRHFCEGVVSSFERRNRWSC